MKRHIFASAIAVIAFGAIPAYSTALIVDSWNGGTGNWGTASNWSNGVPGFNSMVTINSGTSDNVTLDVPGQANSLSVGTSNAAVLSSNLQNLTVGGSLTNGSDGSISFYGAALSVGGTVTNSGQMSIGSAGATSGTMTVGGDFTNSGNLSLAYTTQTVTIGGALTNNSGGAVYLGQYNTLNTGSLSNSGFVNIDTGSNLNLTSQPAGISSIANNSALYVAGAVNVVNGGTTSNGLAGLNNIGSGADFRLYGQNFTITPTGGTLSNAGGFGIFSNGATNSNMTIDGDFNNSGNLSLANTNQTLTITGTLMNSGTGVTAGVYLNSGNTLNTGCLSNTGYVNVGTGSNLNLTNQPGGISSLAANSALYVAGNIDVVNDGKTTNALAGLNNIGSGVDFRLYGQSFTITPGGTLSNSGTFGVFSNGATNSNMTINGDFLNTTTGNLSLANTNQTLTITGTLTNYGTSVTAGVYLNTNNTLNVGSLQNFGILNMGTGSTLGVAGSFTNAAGASTSITGTLDPTTYVSGGATSVAPGGTLVVGTGSPASTGYFQYADGTLEEQLFGAPSGNACTGSTTDCGIINVDGSVTLAGILDPVLENGFDPSNGQSFLFLSFTGSLNGEFSSIENQYFNNDTQQWLLTYGSNYVELTAEAYTAPPPSTAPEPAALFLMAAGLLGIAFTSRKIQLAAPSVHGAKERTAWKRVRL